MNNCSRFDDKDTDEELCWMEKSLEETTIEMPTKASPLSETDNEPASTHPTNSPSEVEKVSSELESNTLEEAPSSHADSLSHLLPTNTYAQISPRCYMFPGAEVTLDNMEGDSDDDSEDDFSDEDDEEENETTSSNANEIIVPDIENILSNEVPVPETSPTPTTSSSLSPTPSTSQLQCNDHEIVENIIDIQADDANDDLEPTPIKRQRLETTGELF